MLGELRAAALGWRWVGWAWCAYCVFTIVLIGTALLGSKVKLESAGVLLVLLGVLLTVGSALSRVDDDHNDSLMPSWLMRLVYSFCFVAILVLAVSFGTTGSVKELAVVVAGTTAAFAVGALLGFIFGVPRSISGTSKVSIGGVDPLYAPNTNLERVSEWLTGIIIGLTLVQFKEIKLQFTQSATEFANSLAHTHAFFASALLIFFGAAGFLIAYLWTRLRLLSDLTRADDVSRREPEYLEGLMHALLYVSPPRGFQRAISLGVEYCNRFGTPNSRVLLYLACAYGQQHKYLLALKSRDKRTDIPVTLEQAKRLALNAIRDCLEHDISLLKWLKSLWDPHDDEIADDDLESLYDDPDAKALFKEFEDKVEAAKKKAEQRVGQ